MSMEQNSNQNLSSVTLCRNGCGFYGSSTFDGMCSKCYKDAIKRRQQSPSPSPLAGRVSPSSMSSPTIETAIEEMKSPAAGPVDTSTTPSVETAMPTVPTPSVSDKTKEDSDKLEEASGGSDLAMSPASSTTSDDNPADKDKRPKKSRCHTCKKKVGLTGFECRCGGLYCSMHRYSDKHDCTFNYKELAQEQIRKNNPVIVSQKIQKI